MSGSVPASPRCCLGMWVGDCVSPRVASNACSRPVGALLREQPQDSGPRFCGEGMRVRSAGKETYSPSLPPGRLFSLQLQFPSPSCYLVPQPP